jgi:hypothetical protein
MILVKAKKNCHPLILRQLKFLRELQRQMKFGTAAKKLKELELKR